MSVRQGNNIIAGGNEIDPTPTSGSSNPVASGGVYTALSSKLNTSADNLTATGLSALFGYLAPDFTSGVSKAANTTHTADTDGWVLFYEFSAADRWFYIDGVQLHLGAGNGSSHYSGNSIFVPISKGHTFSGAGQVTFYPVIGV